MALHLIDPYAFANSSQYQDAMNRPSSPAEPQQPDLVSQFLERLMSALNEDEPSAEEMVAPARSPAQGFRLGVQNAYAWQPEEQRAERGNLLYEQQLGAMDEARQRPAKVAQMQQSQRDRGLQRMTQGLNVASLMEQRQAHIQQLGQRPAGGSITRGNVRTDIGVYDPKSPTGMSDIDYQLVPQPDGSVRTVEIARRPQAVRSQSYWGQQDGQTGRVNFQPVTGATSVNTSLQPIPPVGIINAAVSNVESKQALDALVGAYNTARQTFGIEYANPSILAGVRAKISQGLSQHQWLRDLELAGISAPKFLQFDAARKRALNSYVKAQTGAQFSIRELDRYEAQFPLPWDDPETARQLLESLAAAVVGRMNSLITQYGGLQNMLNARPAEVDSSGAGAGQVTPPASPGGWRSLVKP